MIRAALVAAALACAVWLGFGLSSSGAQAELIQIGIAPEPPPPPARIAELERRALRLNPDRRVRFVDGLLLRRRGEHAAAAASFLEVARGEPANVEAWALTARSAREAGQAKLAQEAAARARALNPLPSRQGEGRRSGDRATSADRTTSSTR